MALAQSNERGQVCYQELVDLVSAIVCGQQGRAPDLAKHSTLAKAGWADSLLGRAYGPGQCGIGPQFNSDLAN